MVFLKVGKTQTFLVVDSRPFGGEMGWTSQRWACSGHFKPSWLIAGHSGGEVQMDFSKGRRTTGYSRLSPAILGTEKFCITKDGKAIGLQRLVDSCKQANKKQ